MVACRCEISLFVLKIFHSFAALTREAFISTLEEKFLVSARPCNILYLLSIPYYRKLTRHEMNANFKNSR